MSEEENKNVIQPEVDEVEVEVVDSQEAATATTKEDELESYTKGVSKRINKLNERNRLAEEMANRPDENIRKLPNPTSAEHIEQEKIMAFVNLKDLKANIGGQLRLTLNSSGVYEEKEWQGKKFNTFKYEVLEDGKQLTLDATDSLKRKLDLISTGDDFLLSWEQFTTNEGQIRNYWKVEKVSKESANPQFDNVKKSVNEFEQQLQKDKALKQQVNTTNSTFTNGARFGMIFNNVVKLYIANDMTWTTDEFVNNFKRVEGWVEACENPSTIPAASKPNEPVQIDDDELPF